MAPQLKSSDKRILGVFTLSMITVSAVLSIRNIPSTAEFGLGSVFIWILAALTFFIPVSLVAAELASGWSKKGGVYVWVREAFGDRWGFVASWLFWVENLTFFPTALSFLAATAAFIFDPSLANNPVYLVAVILVVFWAATLSNFFGMRISGWISTVGVILGTILPGIILIVAGGAWVVLGNPIQIEVSASATLPDFSSIGNIVFLAGALLAFAGMELTAVHAEEVRNPQRGYPRAILIATIIILLIYILATLAVAIVVPEKELSLVAGLMQAIQAFFKGFNIGWIVPVIAGMIVVGVVALVNTWIIGPAKAFVATAQNGDLPPWLQRENRHGAPVAILLVQGVISSVLALLFIFSPSVSDSFWILSALTIQLYIVMYLLMFLAAIRLRYTQPDVKRSFRIPGPRNIGMWIAAGVGFAGSLFTFVIGFFPPSQVATGSTVAYVGFMVLVVVIFSVIPFFIYRFRKAHWADEAKKYRETE